MDDKSIIRLLQKHPEQGLYEAIRKYEAVLSAVAGRLLRDSQDVEECVSDAFVGAWKHARELDPAKGSLKGYLICAVRNNAINRARSLSLHPFLPLWEDAATSPESAVEDTVLLETEAQLLLGHIRGLEEPDRQILLRRYFLLEPIKTIAEKTGLAPHQVKYRLHRSKDQLRELLTEQGVAI